MVENPDGNGTAPDRPWSFAPLPLSLSLKVSTVRPVGARRIASSADPPPLRRIALQTAKTKVAVLVPERLWEISPSAGHLAPALLQLCLDYRYKELEAIVDVLILFDLTLPCVHAFRDGRTESARCRPTMSSPIFSTIPGTVPP